MTTTNNDVDDDGDSDDNNANDKDGSDGDNDDGEIERDSGDNDNNDYYYNVNVDVWGRHWRWDDNNAMAMRTNGWQLWDGMGGQRHAECLQALCHPSESTINLCRQFMEE